MAHIYSLATERERERERERKKRKERERTIYDDVLNKLSATKNEYKRKIKI
jgi:hypothetical protein